VSGLRLINAVGPGTADRIRLIVEEAFGPGYWDGFQRYMGRPSRWGKEWRFGGQLGFGGKVYLSLSRLYVSCYPEDETPELRDRIAEVNSRLAAVLDEVRAAAAPERGE
jgi:hypothetical protein